MKLTEQNGRILKQFADMMIARMEAVKAGDWEKGWLGASKGGVPVNINGKAYRGGNVFMLMLDSAMKGYDVPVYCTMLQANRMHAHVNKGEKSTPVIFWEHVYKDGDGRQIDEDAYHNLSDAERASCKRIPVLKAYRVFNIAQTNLEEKQPDKIAKLKAAFTASADAMDEKGMYCNDALDRMLAGQAWLCPVNADKPSDKAFYSPEADCIVLPMKKQFKRHRDKRNVYVDGQEFYSTLIHEMVHSTGIESRLNRGLKSRFGSEKYAKEELVAELGAARVCYELGFASRVLANSAAYLDSWIASLRQEPAFILTVMNDVEKASKMILDRLA